MSTNEEVIMTVKLWGLIDSIYVLIIILNPIHILFSAFCSKFCLFLIFYLFMKLTHIQVFKKRMQEARIKCFVYKQIPCSFF